MLQRLRSIFQVSGRCFDHFFITDRYSSGRVAAYRTGCVKLKFSFAIRRVFQSQRPKFNLRQSLLLELAFLQEIKLLLYPARAGVVWILQDWVLTHRIVMLFERILNRWGRYDTSVVRDETGCIGPWLLHLAQLLLERWNFGEENFGNDRRHLWLGWSERGAISYSFARTCAIYLLLNLVQEFVKLDLRGSWLPAGWDVASTPELLRQVLLSVVLGPRLLSFKHGSIAVIVLVCSIVRNWKTAGLFPCTSWTFNHYIIFIFSW